MIMINFSTTERKLSDYYIVKPVSSNLVVTLQHLLLIFFPVGHRSQKLLGDSNERVTSWWLSSWLYPPRSLLPSTTMIWRSAHFSMAYVISWALGLWLPWYVFRICMDWIICWACNPGQGWDADCPFPAFFSSMFRSECALHHVR